MKKEFVDCYESMFTDSLSRLQRVWKIKLSAMK